MKTRRKHGEAEYETIFKESAITKNLAHKSKQNDAQFDIEINYILISEDLSKRICINIYSTIKRYEMEKGLSTREMYFG